MSVRDFASTSEKEPDMFLWLDDQRDPWSHGHIGAKWVKTADAAIAELMTRQYTSASLDHDLSILATMGLASAGEKTGYTVACWLEQNPEYLPRDGVSVHSMNPAGAERMRVAIASAYRRLGIFNTEAR